MGSSREERKNGWPRSKGRSKEGSMTSEGNNSDSWLSEIGMK